MAVVTDVTDERRARDAAAVIHPDDFSVLLPLLRSALGGRPATTEYRAAATGRWYLVDAEPLDSGAARILVLARDITERVRREAELREVKARDRQSFEHAPIGVALVGLDGAWLAVNAALCALLDRGADDLRSHTFQDLTHPGTWMPTSISWSSWSTV